MSIENNEIINTARNAAKKAGDFLLQNFGNVGEVIVKGDRNLATDLDKAAEKMIVDDILTVFPDHNVLGEEEEYEQKESEYLWIVDPLDGTHNFIRGINIFGVSVGLWFKNEFIAGVVYMPVDDEMYYAYKGMGAYKNGKAISVSKISEMKEASCSFDSSIRYNPETMLAVLNDAACESFNVRMFGSSVRLLTYVAEGVIDYAIEFHDRPWDFAGSVCLIKEAGGVFSGLKGDEADPKTVGYIASNAELYDVLNPMVKQHLVKRSK